MTLYSKVFALNFCCNLYIIGIHGIQNETFAQTKIGDHTSSHRQAWSIWTWPLSCEMKRLLLLHTVSKYCAKYERPQIQNERGFRAMSRKIEFKNIWHWPLAPRSYPNSETFAVIYTQQAIIVLNVATFGQETKEKFCVMSHRQVLSICDPWPLTSTSYQ